MENSNQPDSIFTFSFDEVSRTYLKKAATWARIGALCAFAVYLITLIQAFFFGKSTPITTSVDTNDISISATSPSGGTGSLIGTIISVLIGATINYFLYRFATFVIKGIDSVNQSQLNEGLGSLRTYYKILGIILLIVLIVFGLAIIAVIISSALGRR